MNIQILKDDPAYPFLDMLQHRKEKCLDVITIADTFHSLLSTLHKTSTPYRPPLNGTSRQVVIHHLGVTKGMLSQYMTISKNIQSTKVKQEIKNNRIWLIDAYYLSKVRGKNQEETEKLQLKEIEKIIEVKHDTKKSKRNFEQNNINPTSGTKAVLRDSRGFPNKYPLRSQSSDACDKPDDSPKIRTFGDSQSSQISMGKADKLESEDPNTYELEDFQHNKQTVRSNIMEASESTSKREVANKHHCSRSANLRIG